MTRIIFEQKNTNMKPRIYRTKMGMWILQIPHKYYIRIERYYYNTWADAADAFEEFLLFYSRRKRNEH